MRHDVSPAVDRGRYPDGVTPWEQETWRAAALDWVDGALAAHGLRAGGDLRVRLRPWSVLMRVPVAGREAVWFKASPPAGGFEAALSAVLARWVPEHVLAPLAVDTDRGWSLLPDGGDLFRDVLERDAVPPRAWEDLLRQYASMQRALVPHAEEIGKAGVPRIRTPELPESFDELLAANPVLTPAEHATLARLRPRLVEWSAELAALGIPDSLDHADLHDGQLFNPEPGRYTFFDWGDAVVSHPFCSLWVPVRRACDQYGADVLPRLRDAYLEPWTGAGRTTAELRRAVRLAWRFGAMGRVRAWGRLFPGAADCVPAAAESARTLLELFEDPPL
ncbi:aminoglycoside phosphotransferase family protein [Streptomyces sp. NPDC002523]